MINLTNKIWLGLLFYGLLAILTGILAHFSVTKIDKKKRWFCTFMSIFLPSLFAGLRYGIGTDYFNYLSIFNQINSSYLKVDGEFLYIIINKITRNLGLNFQFVLFVTSLITTLFIYLALKKYKNDLNIGLGMFIYMMMYYQISYNAVRQIAALAILLYSIQYITERKLLPFTLSVIAAIGFHNTAILFYPLYFLNWLFGTSEHKILKIVILSFMIMLAINFSKILYPIFSKVGTLSYYADSYLYSTREFELRIGLFIRTVPLILPGIIFWNDLKQDNRMMLIFHILIFGCIALIMAYSSTNYTERISYYFLNTQIIFVPYIFRKSLESNKIYVNKKLIGNIHIDLKYIGILLVLAIIALWWWDFIYMGRNETIPYNWIF